MSFDVDVALTRAGREFRCRIEPTGGATVLFGPSGGGKTTVLNMIAGLVRPDRGHVRASDVTLFDAGRGIDLPPERRRAGYVFQDARLFPHRRVRANLLYGASGVREPDPEVVRLLGIDGLLDRWPRTLSGGEARRVAIGRALLSAPAFLLLDEPLAALDRARREEILALIERLRDATRLPLLLVTHDRAEAERLGARIVPVEG